MLLSEVQTPGVYREEVFPTPPPVLLTGVPAFLGYVEKGEANKPILLTLWDQFAENFGAAYGYLAYAVRGFFENGGSPCYVVPLDDSANALTNGLEAIAPLNSMDLVCAPDLMRKVGATPVHPPAAQVQEQQKAILEYCQRAGDRFAILDSLSPTVGMDTQQSIAEAIAQRGEILSSSGALYYPWVKVSKLDAAENQVWVPPCGHVAGVYARSDRRVGVHKAPANELLEGVLDLKYNLTDAQQGQLNPLGINCLRAFRGRGIRVWGARTLSRDPNWTYINVRRLMITIGRWLELNLADAAFEPNNLRLWLRIEREISGYLGELLRQGALRGPNEESSFFVKCNAETNPPEVRDAGMAIAEIGIAPSVPAEFITMRIILGASGVSVAG
ncbi:MAG: phage tail sheath family protein [Hormoscilla sp. GUM202]|nr:phage tail sheath family protein [Hormoscilla sp. GUM202]